jgi:hypothetical protein
MPALVLVQGQRQPDPVAAPGGARLEAASRSCSLCSASPAGGPAGLLPCRRLSAAKGGLPDCCDDWLQDCCGCCRCGSSMCLLSQLATAHLYCATPAAMLA